MATGTLTLNGQEAEATFGLVVVDFSGLLGAPERAISLLNIPALAGALDPGITPNEAVRVVTVNFLAEAATDAALHAVLDKIKEVCGTGLVQITTLYSTTRALYGVLQPLTIERFEKTILGWVSGAMSFVCPCPYWIATTSDVLGFGSTAVDVPLGTAPATGRDEWSAVIDLVGAATTPTLTYLDSAGNTVGTMVFTSSPLAGDHIRIDLGRRLVTKSVSGVYANAFGDLTAGYTFPALDPADGSFANSLWPKLKVSAGTGILAYTKHYR